MSGASIAERYSAGLTYRQIAEAEGLTINQVRGVVIDSGVTPRPRGAGYKKGLLDDPERAAKIGERYNSGETLQAIGESYGLSRERVRQILDKLGIERRHPPKREKPVGFRDPGDMYVYFARAGNGLVKIGCSNQPETRLTQIAEWVPYQIELEATIRGTFDLEAALHRMFAASWSHLEWFHCTPSLERLIDDIRSGRPFAIAPFEGEDPRQAVIRRKKQVSRRLTEAEKKYGGDMRCSAMRQARPDWVRDAVESFSGPAKPAPSEEAEAAIDRYIAMLADEYGTA